MGAGGGCGGLFFLHMAHCSNVFTSHYGPKVGGLIRGTHLWTATVTLETQIIYNCEGH